MSNAWPPGAGYVPSATPAPPGGAGKATASLILGICGLFSWLCPFVGLAGSITGLVLGVQARRAGQRGMAQAGVILCLIGLAGSLANGAYGAYLGATGQLPILNALKQAQQAAPPNNPTP